MIISKVSLKIIQPPVWGKKSLLYFATFEEGISFETFGKIHQRRFLYVPFF